MRSPVVYLIAQPTIPRRGGKLPDLGPLTQYGEIVTLVLPGEYPSFNPERTLKLIRQRLANFDPDIDYLVWAGGDTLSAVLVGAVLAEMECTGWCWLRHERGRDPKDPTRRTEEGSHYTPIDVNFMDEPTEGQVEIFAPPARRTRKDSPYRTGT